MQIYYAMHFFYSCLKKANKKKINKKRHRKIVSSLLKIQNFTNLFTGARVRNIILFGFVQYLPTPELKIFVGKHSLTLESGTL
jgi:hypothetical protein